MNIKDYENFAKLLDPELMVHAEEDNYFYFLYEDPSKGSLLIKETKNIIYIMDNSIKNIASGLIEYYLNELNPDKIVRWYNSDELEFNPLTVDLIPKIRRYLTIANIDTSACDYTIGGIFMWRDFYSMEYAISKDNHTLYLRMIGETDGKLYYMLPIVIGEYEDLLASIRKIIDYEIVNNGIIRFATIPKNYIKIFTYIPSEICLEEFTNISIAEHPKYRDYLYIRDDIIALRGKKYSKIRNHINKFSSQYAYRVEPLTENNVDKAINFFTTEYMADKFSYNPMESNENKACLEVLQNMDNYKFKGIIMYIDDKPVGFTLGEERYRTLFVHIEKADRKYSGIYQTLFHEFLLAYGQDVSQINREEDMGIPGLEKAKLAYQPDGYATKWTVAIDERIDE